jgi:glycosyltransferase involved in cell wall biosynthesis
MNRGGVETWLMHILRHIDRERFQMDFFVHTAQPCAYDDEIRALGSKVISCPLRRAKPWLYARNFKRILRECGPYDIVHSHVHHFSGYLLRLAKQVGVPVCIAHSHSNTSSIEASKGWFRLFYLNLMKLWIFRYATIGLGASRQAAADLFGSAWESDPRWRILYCGTDLIPYQKLVDPVIVRTELCIPANSFVIGHVGRIDEPKNHLFLVEIAAEVAKREPEMRLLLVGDGSLRLDVEKKVAQLSLTDRVVFAGTRSDVPRLILGAMDVFVFPSIYEGLPVALLEAQAAKLPCIFSDIITDEVEVVKPIMRRMSLSQPASAWADAILADRYSMSAIKCTETLKKMEQSPFNISKGVESLTALYSSSISYAQSV